MGGNLEKSVRIAVTNGRERGNPLPLSMAQGKIVMERAPEVKDGDAMVDVTVYTNTGKTLLRYIVKSYTGNVPSAHRSNIGAIILEMLKAKFGNIVHELPGSR